MNTALILFAAIRTLFVAVFLGFGTTILLYLERKIFARAQHRPGANRAGAYGEWQMAADFLKVFSKWRGDSQNRESSIFLTTLPLQLMLPLIFTVVLFGAWHLSSAFNIELLILFFLVVLSAVLESFYLLSGFTSIEKYEYRRHIALNLAGSCGLLLSILTVALHTGSFSLHAVRSLQTHFPFHAVMMSPGLFLAGCVAFLSFFLILAIRPVGDMGNQGALTKRQFLFFFYKRMWFFSLISFWVFVFAGAMDGLFGIVLFFLKIILLIVFSLVLQTSLPKLRVGDALEAGVRFLLPLGLIGLLIELFWIAWWVR